MKSSHMVTERNINILYRAVRLSFVTFKICSGAHLSADAPGESARLWRANVKIQLHNLQGNSGLSLCIYLEFKRMCGCSSVDPSINPNIFPEWMRSFFTQQKQRLFRGCFFFFSPCEAVRADVFKWLSAAFLWHVPAFRNPKQIKIKFRRAAGPVGVIR